MHEPLIVNTQTLLDQFRDALESFDRSRAEALFQQALAMDPPLDMVESLIVPTLERIGSDWESGCIALSQVYMSGRMCEDLVSRAFDAEHTEMPEGQPRRAIVVLHDYHMLGKRIVYSILRASGFPLLDYGRLSVEELVERVIVDRVEELLISVLMLPSALKVREVRNALRTKGVAVRILVGGAPFLFDPDLWREVGADAMGRNAAEGIRILRQWEGQNR
ncbi:MAG: cobalamin-dependent protein [Magnetococcales bacterium]|nr:cobalamin-dependent protein [Magnetococcales bacterium]